METSSSPPVIVLMTINSYCCFNRKPTPHSDHLFQGCCSIVCVCIEFEFDSAVLDTKCRSACMTGNACWCGLWHGDNNMKNEGHRSRELCCVWSTLVSLVYPALANVSSVQSSWANLLFGGGLVCELGKSKGNRPYCMFDPYCLVNVLWSSESGACD